MNLFANAGLALIAVFTCLPAQAQVMFGIPMGQPLSIPECKGKMERWGSWTYDNDQTGTGPCYAHIVTSSRIPSRPLGTEQVSIRWAPFKEPRVTIELGVTVDLIAGAVHSMTVTTLGAKNQDEAFNQLLEKFGKPSNSETRTVQNRMGAKYESIVATWRDGESTISFMGIANAVDRGIITVETATFRAKHAAEREKRDASLPKM